AVAVRAAAEGYEVIVHGRSDSDELRAVASSLKARYVFFDVSDEAEVKAKMSELIQEVGGIDVLVNNAGILKPGTVLESNNNDWLEQFKVNVLGMVNLVRAVATTMQERGGSIVNVASARGHANMAAKRIAAYSATKAAVINLTVTMAQELAP